MTFEDVSRWKRLSLQRHFRAFEKQLMARTDKGILLSIRIARMKEFLFSIDHSPYSSKLINIYAENYGNGIPLQTLLDRIEKLRAEMHKVRYEGEKFPWTEVAEDFVNEKRPNKILKRIVCWYCCQFALDTYLTLLDAVQKNSSDNKLKKIFEQAYEMKGQKEIKKGKDVFANGFEWNKPQNGKKLSSLLYEGLLKEQFIDAGTDKEAFDAIFSGNEVENKIHWTESLPHLIYLFKKLAKDELKTTASIDGFIESDNWNRRDQQQFSSWLYPKLCNTFTDEKGQELTSSKLRNAFNQMKNRSIDGLPLRAADIDEILERLNRV
jgi:hypothetical protein